MSIAFQQLLMAYVDGMLEPSESRLVEGHLACDSPSRTLVEAMRRLTVIARKSFEQPMAEALPCRMLKLIDHLTGSLHVISHRS